MMSSFTNTFQKLKSTMGIAFVALLIWAIIISVILTFQEERWWILSSVYHNNSHPNTSSIISNDTITKIPSQQSPKIILAWSKWFHVDWPSHYGPLKCGQYKCLFTNNKTLFPVSDVLLFHGADTDMNRADTLPTQTRPCRQLWGFQTMENPYVSKGLAINVLVRPFLNNIFNLMLTYSRQSDVRRCYGRVIKKTNKISDNHDYFKGKTKLMAWASSGCYKGRMNFVRNLNKLIPIDSYGLCGNLSCPRSANCWNKFAKEYKFYLSIENFICRDYVSEKLYNNAYKHNMIPVVVGGANYTDHAVAAPGSYIDAQEFPTMKALADHIIKVANNATLYNSYFKWKSSYQLDKNGCDHDIYLCELCQKLHNKNWVTSKIKRIPDITRRWGVNSENCIDYNDVFIKNKTTGQVVTRVLKSQLHTKLKY